MWQLSWAESKRKVLGPLQEEERMSKRMQGDKSSDWQCVFSMGSESQMGTLHPASANEGSKQERKEET